MSWRASSTSTIVRDAARSVSSVVASVRSRAAQLVADGVQLLLPVPSFALAKVQREYRYDAGGWQKARTTAGVQLDAWMAQH